MSPSGEVPNALEDTMTLELKFMDRERRAHLRPDICSRMMSRLKDVENKQRRGHDLRTPNLGIRVIEVVRLQAQGVRQNPS